MGYYGWKGHPNAVYTLDHLTKKVVAISKNYDEAVQWIIAQENPYNYGNYSRYALSKQKLYPNTKTGNQRLEQDLAEHACSKISKSKNT